MKNNLVRQEPKHVISDEQIRHIRDMANGLSYGTITLVFQDGKLIQIDRSEKIRL